MDMRNNNRRNVLTHVRVNFSQSETSSLQNGGGGLILSFYCGGGINRKDPKISPEKTTTQLPKNSEMVFSDIFGSCNQVSRKIRKLYGAKIKTA